MTELTTPIRPGGLPTTNKAEPFFTGYLALVMAVKKVWHRHVQATRLNLRDSFPLFWPNTTGTYRQKAALARQAIAQTFPAMNHLALLLSHAAAPVEEIETFPESDGDLASANELKKHLDEQGSDKANYHNYHHLYGTILKERHRVKAILEIGIGTNNPDLLSNMGKRGRPGASLKAFRNFLPSAVVYGADIDREVLFTADRINTFYVDQTDPDSFIDLARSVPSDLDMVVDDGLHSLPASMHTLGFGLSRIGVGGWTVVEDIPPEALPVWRVVAALLPPRFHPQILRARRTLVFAVRRNG